jgi:hypothetical protein
MGSSGRWTILELSLLALALVSLVGIRTAILVSVVPGLPAAVAIFIAIREAPRLSSRTTARMRIRLRPLLRGPLGRPIERPSCFTQSTKAVGL